MTSEKRSSQDLHLRVLLLQGFFETFAPGQQRRIPGSAVEHHDVPLAAEGLAQVVRLGCADLPLVVDHPAGCPPAVLVEKRIDDLDAGVGGTLKHRDDAIALHRADDDPVDLELDEVLKLGNLHVEFVVASGIRDPRFEPELLRLRLQPYQTLCQVGSGIFGRATAITYFFFGVTSLVIQTLAPSPRMTSLKDPGPSWA